MNLVSSRTYGSLAALVLMGAACAHKPVPAARAPTYTPEQIRARAGRWGGPEVALAADAMAYAAGRAPEVGALAEALGHHPLVRVEPLVNETAEDIDAEAFVRAFAQALTNGGRIEVASQPATQLVDGHMRTRLASEPVQIEGQHATLYTLEATLRDAQGKALWQRRELIRKWSAPSPGVASPAQALPAEATR